MNQLSEYESLLSTCHMFSSPGVIGMCLVLCAKMGLSISSMNGCLHWKKQINERKEN